MVFGLPKVEDKGVIKISSDIMCQSLFLARSVMITVLGYFLATVMFEELSSGR